MGHRTSPMAAEESRRNGRGQVTHGSRTTFPCCDCDDELSVADCYPCDDCERPFCLDCCGDCSHGPCWLEREAAREALGIPTEWDGWLPAIKEEPAVDDDHGSWRSFLANFCPSGDLVDDVASHPALEM